MALVGLQGRGLAEVVQAPCCHSFLLNTLIFQRPFEGHYTSGTLWEPKTLESNKSVREIEQSLTCLSLPHVLGQRMAKYRSPNKLIRERPSSLTERCAFIRAS